MNVELFLIVRNNSGSSSSSYVTPWVDMASHLTIEPPTFGGMRDLSLSSCYPPTTPRVPLISPSTDDGPSYAGSRWALYYCPHSRWSLGVRGSPRRHFLSMRVVLEMDRNRDMNMAGTHIRGRRARLNKMLRWE